MPFDNSNPARAYFRESTAALAARVETRPAADVLRDQVAALLSAEVVPVAKPRISVTAVLRPVVVWLRSARRDAVRRAWQARAEARAA